MSRNLLNTVLGHLALLAEKYPKKAASPVARRAKTCIEASLRRGTARPQSHQQARRAA